MLIYQVVIAVNDYEDYSRITLGVSTDPKKAVDMAKLAYGFSQEDWDNITIFLHSDIKVVIHMFEENRVYDKFYDDSFKDIVVLELDKNAERGWYISDDLVEEVEKMLCLD